MNPLTLPEHLLLLALRDDKGTVVSSTAAALPYGLAGALVMELSMRGSVLVGEKALTVENTESTGDDILDDAVARIADAKRPRDLKYWIARPNSLATGLKERLQERLVDRGILQREEHRFLWLVPYNRYPELDGTAENDLRRRIHDVVLHGKEADEPTALLITLVHSCDLAREVFPENNNKEVKRSLKEFSEGTQISKVVSDQVTAVTMMIITSAITTSMITTSHS
jgi:golgi phosphoprotein 3